MGRRRTSSAGAIEVSLFPFLSILVCLIGSLVILIVALSLLETSRGTDDESVNRAREHEAMVKRLAALNARADAILKESTKDDRVARLLARQREVDALQAKVSAVKKPSIPAEQLQRQIATLDADLAKAKAREDAIKRELADAEIKLGQLSKAAPLPVGIPLRVLPGGGFARNLQPIFIETRKDDVIIHSPSRVVTVPRGQLGSHADFQQASKFAAESDDRILVFLIRPDSRQTFVAAQDTARKLGAVTGKVPLDGDGELDLTGFLGSRR